MDPIMSHPAVALWRDKRGFWLAVLKNSSERLNSSFPVLWGIPNGVSFTQPTSADITKLNKYLLRRQRFLYKLHFYLYPDIASGEDLSDSRRSLDREIKGNNWEGRAEQMQRKHQAAANRVAMLGWRRQATTASIKSIEKKYLIVWIFDESKTLT